MWSGLCNPCSGSAWKAPRKSPKWKVCRERLLDQLLLDQLIYLEADKIWGTQQPDEGFFPEVDTVFFQTTRQEVLLFPTKLDLF